MQKPRNTPAPLNQSSSEKTSEKMIDKIQTAGVAAYYMKGTLGPHLTEAFREQPMANAYQWDAVFADGDFYKSGMNGQGIYVSPGKDAVVVWHATGGASVDMEAYARAIVTSL